ncbi:MAG: hypothetical protein JSS61_00035 [Verrucomicrobia bacterium]|nr:hypothetical protein [Verrucomicrobiota bacterium]
MQVFFIRGEKKSQIAIPLTMVTRPYDCCALDTVEALTARANALLRGVAPLKPRPIHDLFALLFCSEAHREHFLAMRLDKYHPAASIYTLHFTALQYRKTPISEGQAYLLESLIDGKCCATYVFKEHHLESRLVQCEHQYKIPWNGSGKREQIAYLRDDSHYFSVPPTFFVDFTEIGLALGSLQYYEAEALKLDPFYTYPERELRRLALHCLEIVQLDPHSGNFLQIAGKLIPIDCGMSFPEEFCQFATPCAIRLSPGPYSEEEKEHIHELSDDAELLRAHHFSEKAIRLHCTVIAALKRAIEPPEIELSDLLSKFYGGGHRAGVCFFPKELNPFLTKAIA